MRRSLLPLAALALALATAGVGLLVQCTTRDTGDERAQPSGKTHLAEPSPALGQPLMLALAQAKNLHHKADVYLREARMGEAIAAVQSILDLRFPPGAPEAEDVVLDARARLARLLVTAGKVEQAMTVAEVGIARATRDSFFLANLHTARGEVLEARAQIEQETDPAAAKASNLEALAAYDRSLAMEEALMKKLPTEVAP